MAAILATESPALGGYIAQTPDDFQQVISKALRKGPEERYQTQRKCARPSKV